MKAKKWSKEIEEANKKLEEYRVPYTYHICSMPYSFMQSIMAKLMKSIPIEWVRKYMDNLPDGSMAYECILVMLEEWEKENE